jgi:predicted nuclease of predicted toxin-antitoxin system
VASRRVVLTHDADFGRLAIADGRPCHGILFLRPGDGTPEQVIRSLEPLLRRRVDWSPPVVAVYRAGRLRIRRP